MIQQDDSPFTDTCPLAHLPVMLIVQDNDFHIKFIAVLPGQFVYTEHISGQISSGKLCNIGVIILTHTIYIPAVIFFQFLCDGIAQR